MRGTTREGRSLSFFLPFLFAIPIFLTTFVLLKFILRLISFALLLLCLCECGGTIMILRLLPPCGVSMHPQSEKMLSNGSGQPFFFSCPLKHYII